MSPKRIYWYDNLSWALGRQVDLGMALPLAKLLDLDSDVNLRFLDDAHQSSHAAIERLTG